MQCEYRDNSSGRVTAAESIADAWSRDGLDVGYREMDPDWRPLTIWKPYRAGTAALYAPRAPTDAEPDAYVPPDPMLEIDRDTMRRLGELADLRHEDESSAVAAAVAAHHATVFAPGAHPAGAIPTAATDPFNPTQPKETNTMRIAANSAGGITECFLDAENHEQGVRQAARRIAEDHGLPIDIELWSANPDGRPPRRLGAFRFVAVDGGGNVVELD